MKNRLLIITFLLISGVSSAQLFTRKKVRNHQNMDKQVLSWGFYLGGNNLSYKINYNDNIGNIEIVDKFGFNVGLISDLRLNDYFNLRLEPGMVITSRTLIYPENYFNGIPAEDLSEKDFMRDIKSTYVYIPILLRFSTKRINNFKPYISLGVATSLNLSSNEKNIDDNTAGEFRSKKRVQFYDIGFGIDFYLNYFKFTPSIRGVFAINDELVRDVDPNSPWTGNINSMKTRGVFINLMFR